MRPLSASAVQERKHIHNVDPKRHPSDLPIAVPEKIEPMTPIKTLSAEKKECTRVEGPAEVKVETNKADGIKVDEVDLKGEFA
jgi:hypothetical protein